MTPAQLHASRPDGTVIADALQGCLTGIEADIRECSNACDTYLKKSTFAKVIHGVVWNTRFAQYVATFNQRQSELQFAVVVQTGVRAEQTIVKLVFLVVIL